MSAGSQSSISNGMSPRVRVCRMRFFRSDVNYTILSMLRVLRGTIHDYALLIFGVRPLFVVVPAFLGIACIYCSIDAFAIKPKRHIKGNDDIFNRDHLKCKFRIGEFYHALLCSILRRTFHTQITNSYTSQPHSMLRQKQHISPNLHILCLFKLNYKRHSKSIAEHTHVPKTKDSTQTHATDHSSTFYRAHAPQYDRA